MKPKKQQDRKSPKKEYESTKSREFEKIAVELYNHLLTGEYSYDEIVAIYKKKYPMFAEKFTAGFCSKLRCGRVLAKVTCCKRNKNSGKRIKRISRVSARKKWRKMSHPLLIEMYQYEKSHPGVSKKKIESLFNVHRSTYWRWKNKFNLH
eukprot:TRINITY_DN289_c0_g1_i1.p1 TRINITY_DN289_c0_g1~~TRINITY_DN289_c0_g1_i1.p1  ORF type:complete len:150 (-),score=26.50 TRINITY_DN289_c0_g1_i1:123-572(-)